MATPTVEGFSISHAAVLDGTTGADHADGDIYGVDDGSLDPDTDSFDNTGDDTILSTWSWLNFCTVTIRGGYIPFKLVALLTGETISSSGTAPNDYYEMLLWTDRAVNVGPKPMRIRVPSRDSNGLARQLDFILFKVQFDPITFDGPSYKDGLKVNYNGKALLSDKDEKGALLSVRYGVPSGTKAAGVLVSRP